MIFEILSLLCGCCFTGELDPADTEEVAYVVPRKKQKSEDSFFASEVLLLGNIVPAPWAYIERYAAPFVGVSRARMMSSIINFDTAKSIGEGVCGEVKIAGDFAVKKINLETGIYVRGEIFCLTRLFHENILHAEEVLTIGTVLHIFLPLCIPLTKLLNHGNAKVAFLVMQGVAEALNFLHQKHVVHGDVKPDNFLLQGVRGVLADFGLATPAPVGYFLRDGPAYTQGFKAPELVNRNVYCEYSDVFAMGKSLQVFMESCLSTPLSSLEEIIGNMVDEDEDERPVMAEVIEELEEVEEELEQIL